MRDFFNVSRDKVVAYCRNQQCAGLEVQLAQAGVALRPCLGPIAVAQEMERDFNGLVETLPSRPLRLVFVVGHGAARLAGRIEPLIDSRRLILSLVHQQGALEYDFVASSKLKQKWEWNSFLEQELHLAVRMQPAPKGPPPVINRPPPGTKVARKLCHFFSNGPAECRKGGGCTFAHGVSELAADVAVPRRGPTWKTQLCIPFKGSRCDAGWDCRFAHGEADLLPRQPEAPFRSHPRVVVGPLLKCAEATVQSLPEAMWLWRFRRDELRAIGAESQVLIEMPRAMWPKAKQQAAQQHRAYADFPADLYIIAEAGTPGFDATVLQRVRQRVKAELLGTELLRWEARFPRSERAPERATGVLEVTLRERLHERFREAAAQVHFYCATSKQPCRAFLDTGHCGGGDRCRANHEPLAAGELAIVFLAVCGGDQ